MRFLLRILLLAVMTFTVIAADTPASDEQGTQARVDTIVSNLLFDRELSAEVSYNVREDGHVIIMFDESVETPVYTEIVNTLRSNPQIPSVTAEQGGRTVCALP